VSRTRQPAAALLVGALATAVVVGLLGHPVARARRGPGSSSLRLFEVTLPPVGGDDPFWTVSQVPFALSPDGRRLVFALSSGAARSLYERALDRVEVTRLPGTDGA